MGAFKHAAGMVKGLDVVLARKHTRDFPHPGLPLNHRDARLRPAVEGGDRLAHDVVPIGHNGNLSKVGDDNDLVGRGEVR